MTKRRFLSACKIACSLLLAGVLPSHAQSIGGMPMQMTVEQSGTRANDVYSPKLIWQTINGQRTLVMYFGGWYQTDPTTLPNDAIYRSICSTPVQCGPAQKVIDPVAAGMGSAAMVNDPAIVEIDNFGRPYLIMYMTGVPGNDRNNGFTTQNNKIYWSMSWADDGVNWSTPQLLIDNAWLPTATVDSAGNVVLFANTNWNNNPYFMSRYNLGPSGIYAPPPQPITTSNGVNYIDMDVTYRSQLGVFQMVAQYVTSGFNSQIDLLDSPDGVNWTVRAEHIVPDGMTPTAHPDSACWVYYGKAPQMLLANIYLNVWC